MRPAAAICLLVLLTWPRPGAAATQRSSDERCRITKLDAIAASTSGALRCWSQALRRGGVVAAPACLAAAEAKLVRRFAQADGGDACPPTVEAAIDAISAYVAARVESTLPVATVTPAPSATPSVTPSAATGCGNGAVEPGEHCDGGPYCDATCGFAFPSLCCAIGQQACMALADIAQADQCFLAGATPHIGASCVSPDPSCVPGQPCAGACTPATFAETRFCCDGGGTCSERTLSNTESLASFLLQCGPATLVEGRCVAGSCVPGS
ncbi:hypothetical protein K2Z84_19990 [Candidatus Binatia bacterium]|jgi:hypothetical protein|nr:hypothetical protein [Candidatus Binatia bacterium]